MPPRKTKSIRQAVRTPQRNSSSHGLPSWAGPLLGLLVGVGATLLVIHHHNNETELASTPASQPSTAQTAVDQHGAAAIPAASSAADAAKKPQFDFYSVLPEKDIRIPDAELKAQARAEQQQNSSPPKQAAASNNLPAAPRQAVVAAPADTVANSVSTGSSYLLQIGSFPALKDAEAFKAKLALQGFSASIQQVQVNGQPYNRVRLGPFHSAIQLEATKKRLNDAGIRSIALKEGH